MPKAAIDELLVDPYIVAKRNQLGAQTLSSGIGNMSRVLIAEDSPTQAEQLRWTLEEAGFAVDVAQDAEHAIELFEQGQFDLVVSDVVMPGVSGYELCKMIKASPVGHDVPVVLLSALNDPMTMIRALECGADNFLTKPYEPEHLLSRIRTSLMNKSFRASSKLKVGLGVNFRGKNLAISSEKEQILDLLLSTVEDIVRTNAELKESREQLATAKATLEQYAQGLESRVEQRTKALQETQEEILELQSQLVEVARLSSMGELAAALAHELNQPLTAAVNFLGAAEIALKDEKRVWDEVTRNQIREAVSRAKRESLRGGEIVRRLREFIARGDVDMRAVSLSTLASEAVLLGLPPALGKSIDLKLRLLPEADGVFADHVQIQQVIVNLVRNAAEAMVGQTNPPASLTVTSRLADDRMVEICVADTGPGLPEKVAAKLFSPFTSSKVTGMGVGLSICKRIIEAHGGRIWSKPARDRGTEFHFTLPATGPSQDAHDGLSKQTGR